MKWNLSATETAGVVGVGMGLSFLGCMLTSTPETTYREKVLRTVGGASLYTGGVVIGTNRPKKGWLAKRKKKSRKSGKA